MQAETLNRRLTAILVADLVGYSRLMGADEVGTLQRLKALRRTLIDLRIAGAGGRIVKTTGDGMLVEFSSPVKAVECAVSFQNEVAKRNSSVPDHLAMRFRVGINLGDVVAEADGDLYGDGVNIAARLETLAEPGGLAISRAVHEQVRDKLPYPFEDQGKRELKNIARPVGVFALSAATIAALEIAPQQMPELPRQTYRKLVLVASKAVLVATGGTGWLAWTRLAAPNAAAILRASADTKDLPRLSIVVLPFVNLSDDPEQAFFVDGITEDLTTDLSHLAGSFVIARNTAFTYKGKPVDVKQLGRDLGVRYVLEGSVRRSGETVTLNAHLVSTETGAHIWADRFDGERSRLGALQVEFVARLARSLDVQMIQAESLRSFREHPTNPDAMDLAMRGWAALNKDRNAANTKEAIENFERALTIDPKLLQTSLGLSRALVLKSLNQWSSDKEADTARAEVLVAKVLAADPQNAMGRFVKGEVFRARGEITAALQMYHSAISSDGNFAQAHALAGFVSVFNGKATELFPQVEAALRLSPRDPLVNVWEYYICHAHTHLAHWDQAIEWCNRSLTHGNLWFAYVDLAAAYAWTDRGTEARGAIAELLRAMPGYTVQKWANIRWSDNPVFLAEYQRISEGLRKAGLPEG